MSESPTLAAEEARTHARERAAANRRGIAFLVGAMVCLILNDTLMKQVGRELPLAQMVFVRGVFATLFVLLAVRVTGAMSQVGRLRQRPVLTRALTDAAGTLMYLGSLLHLPLANATAINLASPLVLAVFAVLFLHERARGQRWLAIAVGFGGVLLVIQPRASGFNAWAWLCLAGTVMHSVRDLLTRRIDPATPSLVVTLASALMVTTVAAVLTVPAGWQPVPGRTLAMLAVAAALLAAGYYLIVGSMRHGEITVVAPFRYTALLLALLMGWAVWREVPNALAWGGIVLLLGAGVYLLHEGRR